VTESKPSTEDSATPKRRWPLGELALALCVAVGALAYLHFASGIRRPFISDPLGPRAFPYLIGGLALVCAVWLAVEALLGRRPVRPDDEGADDTRNARTAIAVALVTAWTLLFFITFERVGFPIGGTVYMLGLTAAFNRGAWLVNIGFSMLVTAGIYFAFTRFLSVPLPSGPLGI